MIGLLFLVIFLFRLTLIDKGLMYWWDERMHWFSMRLWADVISGNWTDFLNTPFNPKIQGRPLWVMLNMIPAGIQAIYWWITGIKTETPQSLYLVGVYNVILSMLVLGLFWLVAKRLLVRRTSTVIAVLIYGLLANSTINVRHMYPIYTSLILYLLSFWILLRRTKINWSTALISGVLAGMGQMIYASYFLFPLFNVVVLIYKLAKSRIKIVGSFGLGYALPIIIMELWARSVGTSIYASISRDPGLNPGLIEALWFLPIYLIEAEGLIGVTLLTLTGFLIILIAVRLWKHYSISLAVVMGLVSLLIYAAFAVTTIWHHRIYARVVHVYILFMILGAVGAMEYLRQRQQRLVLLLVGMISIYSFYQWAKVFVGISYPLDIKFKICGTYYRCPETVMEIDENNPGAASEISAATKFILVNTIYMFPIMPEPLMFTPPENFRLITAVPHPLNFVPYQLEGYSPQERSWLKQRNYAIKVYQNINQP